MKFFLLLLLSFFLLSKSFSQPYLKVLNLSDAGLSFVDQAKKINRFFDTATGPNRGGYKQWKRKEWFALQHLTPEGKVENYGKRNFEILNQLSAQRISATNGNGGSWTNIGYATVFNGGFTARQGRVNCIAFHPTNPDIIYIGTAGGGIWKSTSGGLSGTWVNLSDNLPVTTFSGLAVAPNGSTIYALTGDGFNDSPQSAPPYRHEGVGVLKSNDGGLSWHQTGLSYALSDGRGGFKIRMHPSNGNTVFAALNTGLWRSTDAGANWQKISASNNVTDFEFKPDNNNILYYTVSNSSLVIRLNLTTLKEEATNINSTHPVTRMEIAVTPHNPNAVYALAGPSYPSGANWFYNGLYFSDNGGTSFSRRHNSEDVFGNGDQSFYDIVLHVNPANGNDVLMGGVRTYRSTNGGAAFTQLNTTNPQLHADDHALERNPLNGYLYLGDDGGVYRSTDNGVTWSNISLNLVINEFYRIAGYQGNNNLLLGGTQDNGQFLQKNLSGVYDVVIPGFDGMDNIIDYTNPNIMYACIQNGGFYKSTNGGANFSGVAVNVGTTNTGGNWITPILQSPAFSNTIFYGSNIGILRSTNGGASWVNIGGFTKAVALAISRFGGRLIATDGVSFQKCDNPNDPVPTWSNSTNPLPSGTFISSLAINPANANDLLVTFSGYDRAFKVGRTIDGGTTWFNYTFNLPDIPVYAVAFSNQNNSPQGGVYIGTELGVFYKDDIQNGWEPFYNGLPRVPVTDLFVNYTSGDVTAATFGRGIWRSTSRSGCPSSYTISGEVYGNTFYQASATINSSQVINSTIGNSLKLRAGTTIRLTNGFKAVQGAYFSAVNAPCGADVPLGIKRTTSDSTAIKGDK